ncbi:MAG: hypothetical protein E7046_09910, partial [Lentisphaerae bacterium]|nr:hypothetical protein [Lentisphaerota bacterium]
MMRKYGLVVFAELAGVVSAVSAALEPIDMRWTFGNHEPVTMYRRVGNRTTGGIEGSALWLEDWHRWYDAESP